VSEPERYGTCSDANGHWGIEDDGKVILSGLVSHDACDAVMDILDERDALKAEVERLTLASQGAVKYVDHTMALARQSMEHHKEIDRLKAEVERLTKAGDAMAFELEPSLKYNPSSEDIRYQVCLWLAAKEGKPHA